MTEPDGEGLQGSSGVSLLSPLCARARDGDKQTKGDNPCKPATAPGLAAANCPPKPEPARKKGRRKRVGRGPISVPRGDFGPPIRLEEARGHDGVVLRPADTIVEDAPDPHAPNSTIRRARRKDPLLVLLRARTIEQYHVEAAERLRADMEASSPSMPGALRFGVHVAPFQVAGLAARHLEAAENVRGAHAAIGADAWPVVDCLLQGSTITDSVRYARVHRTKATNLLCDGLERLARHFGLAPLPGRIGHLRNHTSRLSEHQQ